MTPSLSKKLVFIFSFTLLLVVLLPLPIHAQGYQLLEPGVLQTGGCYSGGEINFLCYLQKIYTTILGVVVILSIIMIAIGGLEYIASGIPGAKGEGIKRINSAIAGLLIALASYMILYTIDPSFVDFNNWDLKSVSVSGGENNSGGNNPGGGNTNPGGGNQGGNGGGGTGLGALAGPRTENETNSQAILRNAQWAANEGLSTCDMPGTGGGNRACAGAVNAIVEAATGNPAGGGLSTARMYEALEASSQFDKVAGGIANAQPGDIIISPTGSLGTGHVGVCETASCRNIISNASRGDQSRVSRNFTSNSWVRTYSNLGVYIFRPLGP